MNTIGIMQPYFFPYIGYWQLINAVDRFVIYDNIQYTKKGWINRNYYLRNNRKTLFSINLEKASDYLDIRNRVISSEYKREKMLLHLQSAYKKAPMYSKAYAVIAEMIHFPSCNLFEYIYNSIIQICKYLDIKTEIIVSSSIRINHSLKSEDRVVALCKKLDGTRYINAINGRNLYSASRFANEGILLQFIKARQLEYTQWKEEIFTPCLSIIDLMMFNSKHEIAQMLLEYDLFSGEQEAGSHE